MPQHFIAVITEIHTYKVSIVAKDEAEAAQKAKRINLKKLEPSSREFSSAALTLEGEFNYGVGSKIKHFLFGSGVIKKLVRTTNCNNEFGHSATIEFDSGEIKDIHLPSVPEKIEILS